MTTIAHIDDMQNHFPSNPILDDNSYEQWVYQSDEFTKLCLNVSLYKFIFILLCIENNLLSLAVSCHGCQILTSQ